MTRRSTTGFVVLINGTAVCWGSTLQRCVALSTMESEYISACQATREIIWLKGLLTDMGVEFGWSAKAGAMGAIPLHCDNEAAVHLSKNHMTTGRSKHIDVQYHYVRECVLGNKIQMCECRTENMVADSLTKAVPKHKVEWCRASMGLV
jgi:hypothetical protein